MTTVIMGISLRDLRFMCLNYMYHNVTCNDMTVFNHTNVCPGGCPVMCISYVHRNKKINI